MGSNRLRVFLLVRLCVAGSGCDGSNWLNLRPADTPFTQPTKNKGWSRGHGDAMRMAVKTRRYEIL